MNMLSYFVFPVKLDEMTFRICLKINNNASFTASPTLDFAAIYLNFERQFSSQVPEAYITGKSDDRSTAMGALSSKRVLELTSVMES